MSEVASQTDIIRLGIELGLAILSVISIKKYKLFKGKEKKLVRFISTTYEAIKDKRITKAEMVSMLTKGNALLIEEGETPAEEGEGS